MKLNKKMEIITIHNHSIGAKGSVGVQASQTVGINKYKV